MSDCKIEKRGREAFVVVDGQAAGGSGLRPASEEKMKVAILATALVLALAACGGPSLDAFNDRGGVISYHMVNSSMADVMTVAERYCSGIGRKAKLGTPSLGVTSMNVSFDCVE
jgi:hypothetical protein